MKIAIIGGGPAGYVSAIRASQLGAEVVLIESANVGGVCTNVGCIPTKTYYHYAGIIHEIRQARADGIIDCEFSTDWKKMLVKKDGIVKRLVMGIEYLLKKNKITLVRGIGSIAGNGKIEVALPDGKKESIDADHIIIATGSEPKGLPISGWEGAGVWSNTEALNTEKIPQSILIVGGGVIGCEFAHIFATFGSKVTIVEVMDTILPGLDPDVISAVTKALAKEGVSIRTGVRLKSLERTSEGIVARTDDETFFAEEIMGAVGRKPTPPNGVELAGCEIENGALVVDDFMSAGDRIWGAGDVAGAPFLAHWASAMGENAVENIFGKKTKLDRDAIPGAFFTAIEVGTVGLTEPSAKDRLGDVSIGMFPYQASGRARTASAVDGFAKVVAEKSGRIVGIHIAGKEASEMLTSASLAVARRMTIDDWKHTIIAHPTFGEILKESALSAIGEAIHL